MSPDRNAVAHDAQFRGLVMRICLRPSGGASGERPAHAGGEKRRFLAVPYFPQTAVGRVDDGFTWKIYTVSAAVVATIRCAKAGEKVPGSGPFPTVFEVIFEVLSRSFSNTAREQHRIMI